MTAKKCTKKVLCTCKVIVLLNKPIAFLTSLLRSPSSLLKLPYDFNEFSLKSFIKNKCTSTLKRVFFLMQSNCVSMSSLRWELLHLFSYTRGRKGWRSSESTRLPPMRLGFNSRRRRHMWVEFVVGSPVCSERFFSGYSGFPFLRKNQHFQIPIRPGFR